MAGFLCASSKYPTPLGNTQHLSVLGILHDPIGYSNRENIQALYDSNQKMTEFSQM